MSPYRSKAEEIFAKDLEARGIKFEYEKESWPYYRRVSSGHCPSCGAKDVVQKRKYRPDFFLVDEGYYVEVKGRLTSRDRTKMQAVIKEHPDKDVRMLFIMNNKLDKHNDTRYSEWADNIGITYAVGRTLPRDPRSWGPDFSPDGPKPRTGERP